MWESHLEKKSGKITNYDINLCRNSLFWCNSYSHAIFCNSFFFEYQVKYLRKAYIKKFIYIYVNKLKSKWSSLARKQALKSFLNGFYRYLTVKSPKTVIHIKASGRCIFYSVNLKFYEKARFLICDKI